MRAGRSSSGGMSRLRRGNQGKKLGDGLSKATRVNILVALIGGAVTALIASTGNEISGEGPSYSDLHFLADHEMDVSRWRMRQVDYPRRLSADTTAIPGRMASLQND